MASCLLQLRVWKTHTYALKVLDELVKAAHAVMDRGERDKVQVVILYNVMYQHPQGNGTSQNLCCHMHVVLMLSN